MALSIDTAHVLDGRTIALETIEDIAVRGARVAIAPAARERVSAARESVERQYRLGAIIYGVTTGFGRMANVVIDRDDTATLQLNLVRSHASGTGAPLSEAHVRAAGVLRASSLAAGHSGIKLETLDLLCELLNRGVTPVVPCQGSVGGGGAEARSARAAISRRSRT
jgi:histidine ammonia-lyase